MKQFLFLFSLAIAAALMLSSSVVAQTLPAEDYACGTANTTTSSMGYRQDGDVVRALLVLVRFRDDPTEDIISWPGGTDRTVLPSFATTLLAPTQAAIATSDSSLSRYFYEQSKLTATGAGKLQFFGEIWPKNSAGQPIVYVTQHDNDWYHSFDRNEIPTGRGYSHLTREILDHLANQPGFDIGNFDLNNDGYLDEMTLIIRTDFSQASRGGVLGYSGCANLAGCDFPVEPNDHGPEPSYYSNVKAKMISVDWYSSGTHSFAHTAGHTISQYYYVRLLAHEWGHHLWGNFWVNHIRALEANDSPMNGNKWLGFVLMSGGSNDPNSSTSGSSEIISAYERDMIGIISCRSAPRDTSGSYVIKDLYIYSDCIKIHYGDYLDSEGTLTRNFIYISNMQRGSFFNEVRTSQIRPAIGQPFAEDGLMTTGLSIGLRRDITPIGWYDYEHYFADGYATKNSNASMGYFDPSYHYAYEGDLYGGNFRQITPWTRPDINGYSINKWPNRGFWFAIDSIRYVSGSSGDMAFEVVGDFRTRPVIRSDSWITEATANQTIPGNLVVRDNATLDVSVGSGNTLTFGGAAHVFAGATMNVGGPGQTIAFNQNLDINGTLRFRTGTTVQFGPNVVLRAYTGSSVVFEPGVTVKLGQWAQLAFWSPLSAQGTSTSRIRFERLNASQAFNQLTLLGNGSVLRHIVIDGGDQNIVLAAQNVTLEHVTLKNGWRGLATWTIPGGGRASATLRNVLIENSTSVGLVNQYADLTLHAIPVDGVLQGATIRNNAQAGLYLSNATAYGTHRLTVTGNGTADATRSGVEIWSGSFTPAGYSYNNANEWGGHNRIYQNANHEVYVGPSGDAVLGVEDFTDGLNSIYDPNQTPTSSAKLVRNDNTGVWVSAGFNWWGTASPASGYFQGLVDVWDALASDPNASAPPASGGGQSAAPPAGFAEADASTLGGAATTERRVQARVRDLLAQVQRGDASASLALATARTLSRMLAADDPMRASLVQARDEAASALGTHRSAALDRLAETATLLQAQDLVEANKASGALALLAASESKMHSPETRRRAALTRMYALVQAGRTGEARTLAERLNREKVSPELVHVLGEMERFAWMSAAPQGPLPGLMEQAAAQVEAAADSESLGLRLWPQPVRDRATLRVALPEAARVTVEVFDLVGRRVVVLLDGPQAAGAHEVAVNTRALTPGMYLVRLTSGSQVRTERMHVLR